MNKNEAAAKVREAIREGLIKNGERENPVEQMAQFDSDILECLLLQAAPALRVLLDEKK